MNCYEKATNVTIPKEVQAAANNEIVTEAEVVNNSNVDPDKLSNTVKEIKDEVISKNITNPSDVEKIVKETAQDNSVNLTTEDVDKIADSVIQTQSVQDSANHYKQQLEKALGNQDHHSLIGF